MKTPHLYVSQGFIVQGMPVDKEEFERETGNKTTFGKGAIFLEDVTLLGSAGTLAEVQYFVLNGSAVSGVGKNNIRLTTEVHRSDTSNIVAM
jgi:hypothetical protein